MKQHLIIIFAAVAIAGTPMRATALSVITPACSEQTTCSSNCTILTGGSNCASKTTMYYIATGTDMSDFPEEYGGVESCSFCPSGANRIKKSFQITGNCTATYYTCECSCSTTAWTAKSAGYETRTVCNTSTCTTTTEYRCAAGYYGTTTNGTSGCNPCTSEDGAAATSPAGTTARTGCYIPSGKTFSNTTGSGTFAGNSYWCN